jgi:hypothetical protein
VAVAGFSIQPYRPIAPLLPLGEEASRGPLGGALCRNGILGCLDLRTFSLGRVTGYPYKYPSLAQEGAVDKNLLSTTRDKRRSVDPSDQLLCAFGNTEESEGRESTSQSGRGPTLDAV